MKILASRFSRGYLHFPRLYVELNDFYFTILIYIMEVIYLSSDCLSQLGAQIGRYFLQDLYVYLIFFQMLWIESS